MPNAQTWIGNSSPGEKLDLDRITAHLPQEATALHEALMDEKVAGLLRIRREASSAAAKAQKSFKRLSAAAVLGTAIATLSSGLLLYGAGSDATGQPQLTAQATGPSSTQPPPVPAPQPSPADPANQAVLVQWVKDYRTSIIAVQVLGLFISAVASFVLSSQGLVQRWAENRQKAELLRREVFNEVLNQVQQKVPTPLAAPDPGNPISQALEFFRRYQHELQIDFYRKGSTRHGHLAGVLTWITALLAGIAAVSGAMGGLGPTALILSAFLGIAVPILLSAAQSWRATSRDSDKAGAYQKAKDALEQILLEIGDVRRKAALGDTGAVRAYMDSVHLVMTTENDAWVPAAPR